MEYKLFDTELIEQFRKRAFNRSVEGADFLLEVVHSDLKERFKPIQRFFPRAALLHSHIPSSIEALQATRKVRTITWLETQNFYPSLKDVQAVFTSREFLSLQEKSLDLIVSLLSLQITNDIVGALIQMRQGLVPDGLFFAVTLGTGSLRELRTSLLEAEVELYGGAHPRVAPFMDVYEAGALLQRAGFALPVVDKEEIIVRYKSLKDLMNDLRNMGMQNALYTRSRRPVSARFFARAEEIYKKKFCDPDGKIRASFSFLWLLGWAPHKDQQKPLKPGTAQISLAKVLQNATVPGEKK